MSKSVTFPPTDENGVSSVPMSDVLATFPDPRDVEDFAYVTFGNLCFFPGCVDGDWGYYLGYDRDLGFKNRPFYPVGIFDNVTPKPSIQ